MSENTYTHNSLGWPDWFLVGSLRGAADMINNGATDEVIARYWTALHWAAPQLAPGTPS